MTEEGPRPPHPSQAVGEPLDGAGPRLLGLGGKRAPAGGWRTATVVTVRHPTPRAVELRLDVPDRVDHLPGQHSVVRLPAADGYRAQRSYSVASEPEDPQLELFVERLDDGEVSPFLTDVVAPGDRLEVRGPIGGWFVWDGVSPALLVGGGSGVLPFLAMLRHARRPAPTDPLRGPGSHRPPPGRARPGGGGGVQPQGGGAAVRDGAHGRRCAHRAHPRAVRRPRGRP